MRGYRLPSFSPRGALGIGTPKQKRCAMAEKLPLIRKIQLAFGSAILALLAAGAISYRGTIISGDSGRRVQHTHEVLENLKELLNAMRAVESSCRGFALTGMELYLENYRVGLAGATQAETAVRNLTADNPRQQEQLPALELLISEKIQFAEKVIGMRRTGGLEVAAHALLGSPAQQGIDEFEKLIGRMQGEELRLLVLREAEAARHLRQTRSVVMAGTALGALIVAGAGWSARRDHFARALANDALREGEGRFRTLANNIPQLTWMGDERGSMFWFNDRWFEYTGTTSDEMIAFAASSSRFFGIAVVSSDRSSRAEIFAISSTAPSNAASFAIDGLLKPVIFRTNCSDAARTSSCVTGGSKLNSVLIFLHTERLPISV